MIEISKAQRIIGRETGLLGVEKIELASAIGRILRENIIADTDLPPFNRSQMDGFAVLAADTTDAPVMLKIIGESAAGKGWHKVMKRGEAVRIMTGAPVPKGADAVQKLELTSEASGPGPTSGPVGPPDQITIVQTVKPGEAIGRRGSEINKGATIFKSGEVITENMIATLAAFGYARLKAGMQPRVAILGTGSEIVDVTKKPGRDQIRNSNSVMIDVLCRKFGAIATVLPIIRDEISDLISEISKVAKNSDILVITGGVSVGKYDHAKTALIELGAEIFFDKVRLKPGKPAVFARLGKTLLFGLPGNPVSAAVTFHVFVRKAIFTMQGALKTDLKQGFAVLASAAKAARDRDTYLPSRLESNKLGQLTAHPLKWQGSSDFIGFARADSLIFVPKGAIIKAGEVAEIAYL
ncbi:MAG: gephyrin-like molybdotransferase Glp [Pyrinomonadaceae bacterium]